MSATCEFPELLNYKGHFGILIRLWFFSQQLQKFFSFRLLVFYRFRFSFIRLCDLFIFFIIFMLGRNVWVS